jgi:hypothetical protein
MSNTEQQEINMSRGLKSQYGLRTRRMVVPMALMALFGAAITPRVAAADDLVCREFDVYVGGYHATGAQALRILNLDPSGNLTGTFWGDPIQGFYNKVSNELMFVRQIARSTDPTYTQVWTGYHWQEAPFGLTELIAGYLEEFVGASADHHRDGWEASCTVVG